MVLNDNNTINHSCLFVLKMDSQLDFINEYLMREGIGEHRYRDKYPLFIDSNTQHYLDYENC